MKVTRKMVAEKAGVTKESVSYVLNRSRPVSDKIVDKVMAAVEELGYVPDVTARSLGNKKSMTIGVVCNDLGNPYYAEIISGIEDAANKKKYILLITEANENLQKSINEMIARHVDGIILLVFPDRFNYDYDSIIDAKMNIVVTHNTGYNNPSIPHIEPDFGMGIREALISLKECGHEKIMMLSAFNISCEFDNRLNNFCKHYKELFGKDAEYMVSKIYEGTTIIAGEKLAQEFIDSKKEATALIFSNDLMAIGALQQFKKNGYSIPEDISLIGIDDMLFSSFVTPGLSTIGYNKRKFGEKLFKVLYKNIYKKEISNEVFPLYYLERESVRVINKH